METIYFYEKFIAARVGAWKFNHLKKIEVKVEQSKSV